jgi:hypothetical protein
MACKRDLIWIDGAKRYLTPGWIAETYAKRIAEWVAANMPARRAQRHPGRQPCDPRHRLGIPSHDYEVAVTGQ